MTQRDETPRDLLFGLLALQIGMIDQDQLVAAFGAWSRAKGKTLAEILRELGAIDAESRSLLSAMAEKPLKLHGGDTEKSLASVGVGPSTRLKLTEIGNADLTASVAASSGSADTLPDSAMGTPAYMSPEQARGDLDRLGPRSDVYSLGATLYCLLIGKAPFDSTDVGALFQDVQKGAFPTPRQLDPTIDKALEAVCLKAMATKAEDRHATARALADDVERWAAGEPTSAWSEPASVRARRWMHRNRTLVTAAATGLMAVVGLVGVIAIESRSAFQAEPIGQKTCQISSICRQATPPAGAWPSWLGDDFHPNTDPLRVPARGCDERT